MRAEGCLSPFAADPADASDTLLLHRNNGLCDMYVMPRLLDAQAKAPAGRWGDL
jgi:hypothetical protein